MSDRTIIVTGPFTDEELAELIATLKRIEQRRPDETFRLIVDDSSTDARAVDALERLRAINPLSPGYQRIIEIEEDPHVITKDMLKEWATEAEEHETPAWLQEGLAQPQHDYDENGQAVAWDGSSSPIDRIKALRNQGYSLTEAKRVVHASLSDEERANVERLWEEMEGGAT